MAASAFSRRASSAAWSTSIADCCHGDEDLVVHAYEVWGFKRLNRELIDAAQYLGKVHLRPFARRPVRTIADGVKPSQYRSQGSFPGAPGAEKTRAGHRAGEFVFMDRAPSASARCFCIFRRNSITIGCS